jgi:hypothetical protein
VSIITFPWLSFARTTNRVLRGIRYESEYPLFVDYPISPTHRYGWGKPAHPALLALIDMNREKYAALIPRMITDASRGLRTISNQPKAYGRPHWENRFIQGLDATTLYAFPKLFDSRQYLEIGSGESTKFVRQSIHDHALPLWLTSVDPAPRAEIDTLCDEVIRAPLETLDPAVVDRLNGNDILMFDGSHRCFQNSDVEVFFLEILPRLKPGVLVFIHDIFLPYDYRPEWAKRWYSEQYMLAVMLMADQQRRYEILFPSLFIDFDPDLRAIAESSWTTAQIATPLPRGATSFWLRILDVC